MWQNPSRKLRVCFTPRRNGYLVPQTSVLLKKLIAAQLVKNLMINYGIRKILIEYMYFSDAQDSPLMFTVLARVSQAYTIVTHTLRQLTVILQFKLRSPSNLFLLGCSG
jgi:hypothetical protein